MSSPSDRVYSMEQLLQFDSSRSQSSAASTNSSSSPTRLSGFTGMGMGMGMGMGISPVALSTLRSLFPDIVPDTTATGADHSSDNMDVDSQYGDEEDEEDDFVYGDVVVRGDLHEDLVEQLRQAVHDALSPRALLTSPITTSSVSSTSSSFASSFANERTKPLSHRAKPSDGPWRSSHPTSTMGSTTRPRQQTNYNNHHSPTYSYHDRSNFGVNLFKQASALHPTSPRTAPRVGAESDNWRQARESRVSSWRNTNVKWNESTSSYVPVVV